MTSKMKDFSAYDPWLTFGPASKRQFVKETGESSFDGWREPFDEDSDALWNLGKNAFDALNPSSREDFIQGYNFYLHEMGTYGEILAELNRDGLLVTQNREGTVIEPHWDNYLPNDLLSIVWQFFGRIDKDKWPEDFESLMRQSFLFASLKIVEDALVASMLDGRGLIMATLAAASAFANAEALLSGNAALRKARREMSYKGAMAKLERDPTQVDKAAVKTYWKRWTNDPDLYENKEEFARDMLDSKTHALKGNPETVKKWVRAWEKQEGIEYPYKHAGLTTKPAQ